MKKFIETLDESQKRKLAEFIQYECLNLWVVTAFFGSTIAVAIGTRRACRKYRNFLRLMKNIGE